MPDFRREPLSGRWVIIAEDRAGRPSEFSTRPARCALTHCPFCAGNEQATPSAVAVYPAEAGPGGSWQVRVIPNKYPSATLSKRVSIVPESSHSDGADALFVERPAVGVHEVIIESPRHVASFTELTDDQARWTFRAYRDRLQALRADDRIEYGLVFKNCRGAGGATLEHAHSQLLATDFVPLEVEQERRFAGAYFDQYGRCLFCELLRQEIGARTRHVAETETLVAFCPFASRFPYEIWIMPREHLSYFEFTNQATIDELAVLIQHLLRGIEELFPDAAYNFWIHTTPLRDSRHEVFHWHLELTPRLTTQAGYEWGSGCFVNPVAPETAARRLRELGSFPR